MTSTTNTSKALPPCKFGEKCYRTNVDHCKKYSHPSAENDIDVNQGSATKNILNSKTSSAGAKINKITDFFGHKSAEMCSSPSRKRKISGSTNNLESKPNKIANSNPSSATMELLAAKFHLNLPIDFMHFWQFCCELKPGNPRDAFRKSCGLSLVGPFDVLADPEILRKDSVIWELHWRYFYDTPEMVTVVAELDDALNRKPTSSGFHMGYFRDDPDQQPAFVAWNYSGQDGTIIPKGDNLFASIKLFGEELIRHKKVDCDRANAIQSDIDSMLRFLNVKKLKFNMDSVSNSMKNRDKKVVAKTFHGAGLVVNVVNDVGYRPLPESAASLRKILAKISSAKSEAEKLRFFEPLQELVTLCQFANDEGDFGESIELGLDLFTFGSNVFHSLILHLLPVGYRLASCDVFADTIEKHLANRRQIAENIDYLSE